MNENKILIFQHIPKTAGSTLRSILKKHYDPDEICVANREEMIKKLNDLSENEMEKIKCLNGHIVFGIHEHLSRPYEYYTLLRDPVEHVISEYYFILRKPNNLSHNIVKNMSFEEFITSEQYSPSIQSLLSRVNHVVILTAWDVYKQNGDSIKKKNDLDYRYIFN